MWRICMTALHLLVRLAVEGGKRGTRGKEGEEGEVGRDAKKKRQGKELKSDENNFENIYRFFSRDVLEGRSRNDEKGARPPKAENI